MDKIVPDNQTISKNTNIIFPAFSASTLIDSVNSDSFNFVEEYQNTSLLSSSSFKTISNKRRFESSLLDNENDQMTKLPSYIHDDDYINKRNKLLPKKKKKCKKDDHKSKHKKHLYKHSEICKTSTINNKVSIKDKDLSYFIDKIPDRNTLQFGCLYEGNVPKYYRLLLSLLGTTQQQILQISKINRFYNKSNRKTIIHESEYIKQDLGFKYCNQDYISFSKWEIEETKTLETYDKIRELENIVQSNPGDLSSWLKLAEAYSSNQQMKNEEAKMDVKESVLKRARDKNPSNIEILIEYFLNRTDINENEWKQILFKHVNDERVWDLYLQYHTRRQLTFNIQRLSNHFLKCIRDLMKINDGKVVTHLPRKGTDVQILSFFARHCLILKKAGCSEKALSFWQSFIELNFNYPSSIKNSVLNEKIQKLETFWDSGLPRFSELNAIGWKNYSDMLNTPSEETQKEDDIVKKYKVKGKSLLWLALEKYREDSNFLPCRQYHEVDDVERIILFEDIKGFLFTSNCHLEILQHLLNFFEIEPNCYDLIDESFLKMSPMRSWLINTRELVLAQMATILEEKKSPLLEFWTLKWFEYLERFSDKKIVKKAKGLLKMKHCQQNSFYWAKLACLLMKFDMDNETYSLIDQTKNLKDFKCCNLYAQIYIGCFGGKQNISTAKKLLAKLVTTENIDSNTAILRCKRLWKEKLVDFCQDVYLDCCYCLFLYTINSTTESFNFIEELLSKKYCNNLEAMKEITNLQINLIRVHLKFDSSAAPKLLNDCIFIAIKKFPNDINYYKILLNLKNERIVRNFLDCIICQEKFLKNEQLHISRCLFEIKSGIAERSLSVLDFAVYHCPNNEFLWRLLIYVTAMHKSGGEVEKVFHRALQTCVYDKTLYTDLVLLVPDKVQIVTDLLTEKMMRIRTLLDEAEILIN